MESIKESFDTVVLPVCRWASEQPTGATGPLSLTHNDFHPANLLYAEDGARILDLEQMTVGPRLKCLALAVSRFTMQAEQLAPGTTRPAAMAALLEGYRSECGLDAVDEAAIPDWIRLYEAEKILRIVRRFLGSGQYPAMLRKVVTHHIPLCQKAHQFRVDKER